MSPSQRQLFRPVEALQEHLLADRLGGRLTIDAPLVLLYVSERRPHVVVVGATALELGPSVLKSSVQLAMRAKYCVRMSAAIISFHTRRRRSSEGGSSVMRRL